jgi:hypothetical protein
MTRLTGIPAKRNAHSKEAERIPLRHRQVDWAEVFAFVKENLSGANRRKGANSGERVRGNGNALSLPGSRETPEREAVRIASPGSLKTSGSLGDYLTRRP